MNESAPKTFMSIQTSNLYRVACHLINQVYHARSFFFVTSKKGIFQRPHSKELEWYSLQNYILFNFNIIFHHKLAFSTWPLIDRSLLTRPLNQNFTYLHPLKRLKTTIKFNWYLNSIYSHIYYLKGEKFHSIKRVKLGMLKTLDYTKKRKKYCQLIKTLMTPLALWFMCFVVLVVELH